MSGGDPIQTGYDAVFAAVPKSPALRRLWHEHVEGADYPPEFGHISFVTLAQLRRMASELNVNKGDTLVDLGCGLAGPALWMARETGADLVGVDLSTVAVEHAAARAAELGLAGQCRFVAGSFADSTLAPASADGVLSEDAIQYAPDKRAFAAEVARLLKSGGRLVFTVFEVEPERVVAMPGLGTDPVSDYRPLLEDAGFSVETYDKVAGWPEPMTTAYSALLNEEATLREEMGEVATRALLLEVSLTLQQKPYRRRVLVAATRR